MKDIGTQTIKTDRLILRRFIITDAIQVYNNWGTDKECNKFLGWKLHENIEETTEILRRWIDEYKTMNSYNWAVVLLETGELIGNIQVVNLKEKHSNCEIGYCYGAKWWNKGYATEALKAVIRFLLVECNINLIEASHISSNPASGKVMEKAGMKFEAILRERRWNKFTEQLDDLVIYSIKKDEITI